MPTCAVATVAAQIFLFMVTRLVLSIVLAEELGMSDEVLKDYAVRSWGTTGGWKEVTGEQEG